MNKEQTTKFCVNCKYVKLGCGYRECVHPSVVDKSTNKITGKTITHEPLCQSTRAYYGKCGGAGKLFERKETLKERILAFFK